ncbi:hypothetical protein FISHEDRAFT_61410 [Fistulina hepatica ATCC 64428]|uniref:Uncharacterized protein n=1 Tax=Fistulina hepatica ATCC 64428 TaxID=1128425 RepID=A0A0D7A585_9AGAR|nr:hypothetical protein FISHEDRAFT_61410 [Fistulina hepatica ATCC 64428]
MSGCGGLTVREGDGSCLKNRGTDAERHAGYKRTPARPPMPSLECLKTGVVTNPTKNGRPKTSEEARSTVVRLMTRKDPLASSVIPPSCSEGDVAVEHWRKLDTPMQFTLLWWCVREHMVVRSRLHLHNNLHRSVLLPTYIGEVSSTCQRIGRFRLSPISNIDQYGIVPHRVRTLEISAKYDATLEETPDRHLPGAEGAG